MVKTCEDEKEKKIKIKEASTLVSVGGVGGEAEVFGDGEKVKFIENVENVKLK